MATRDFLLSRHALLSLIFLIIAVVYYVSFKAKGRYKYPPGPRGLPIFGNLFQLPPSYPGPQLAKWSEQYGEL